MAAIDLSASEDENGNPMTVETEALWNWKKNIDLGIEKVKSKVNDMKNSIPNRVEKFNKENAPLDGSKHKTDDKKEGGITFINCQSEIGDLVILNDYMDTSRNKDREDGDKGLVKSLLDADLIKRYNGTRFLNELKVGENDKVYWEIDDYTKQSGNYVEKVCSIKI